MRSATLLLILLALTPQLFSQEKKAEGPNDMAEYQMLLVRATPVDWKLPRGGNVLAGGPVESGNLKAAAIINGGKADVEALMAGITAESHPWWTSKTTLEQFVAKYKGQKYYLVFLMRGDAWTPKVTPETQEIQKRHLANIEKLYSQGKLLLAGPFGDEGVLRGIFVLKAASLEQANEYCNTDPAVQAGRLKVDVMPWTVN